MHEVSLMEGALATVFELAQKNAGTKVLSVQMRVGALSGVVPEALEFAFEALTPGTPAEGARLEVERVPAVCYCNACLAEAELAELEFSCPRCQGTDIKLVRGREFELTGIEVS